MPQTPIPDELGGRFTVADARGVDVTAGRLRGRDLVRSFHGVRRRADTVEDDAIALNSFGKPRGELERRHLEFAADYATRMEPWEFFSHVTAAVLWGLPLPAILLVAADLDVAVMAPRRLPRSKGIYGHEALADRVGVRVEPRTGLRVASPVSTWGMLGGVLRDPYDLVAAGDAVLRDWRTEPLATDAEIDAMLAAGRRVGIGKLRAARPLLRSRSASRPETRCRLLLVDAGLREPELNFDVYASGLWLACVDLAYPELRIAIEYEGEHHLLDPEQWARDIARYEALAAAGWLVIRVTKAELFGRPHDVVRRVRAAVAARR